MGLIHQIANGRVHLRRRRLGVLSGRPISRPRKGWVSPTPYQIAPNSSLMPHSPTIRRARPVACFRSLSAPVVGSPNTNSSAAAPAQQDGQPAHQVGTGVVAPVLLGELLGHPQGAAVGDDRDLADRVRPRRQPRYQGVAALVVGHHPPLLLVLEAGLAGTQDDLVHRLVEVPHGDLVGAPAPGSRQGRLVGQVGQVGAGEARACAGPAAPA